MWSDPARNSWSHNTRGVRLVFITVTTIITCPISTGLNTLIMIAVKTEHRVKTKSNIALACLSSTDAVMGVIGQPLFISWVIAELQGNTFSTYLCTNTISENGLKSVRCGITVSPGYGERRTLHCHQTFFEVWNLSHWNSLDYCFSCIGDHNNFFYSLPCLQIK